MKAYDLEMLKTPFDPAAEDHHGWVFGLPPGIEPLQWPLDPASGYPLMHGFTLELPEDHRVHGPDIVALSFFAVAPDHNDGGPVGDHPLPKIMAMHPQAEPEYPHVAALWRHGKNEHPRLHRMQDILGCEYAVILLTREEYEGPPCAPPSLIGNPILAGVEVPKWLRGIPRERGSLRPTNLEENRAVRRTVRANDPNAGIKPVDLPGPDDDYEHELDESWQLKEWAKDFSSYHIGGTIQCAQAVPDIGPHYIGFFEDFGDYNFAYSHGQLDFEHMKFDWASD